ncbi:MAG: hypothetical protein GPJ54_07455 [Candidatus Heimdallarchaeota archaeon]|nr:hypothetical protein [Candidatus Heimdallarchaeota archaeon]
MTLNDLEFEHILLITAGIIALLPSYKLFRLFFETRIGEYFLFGLVFFVSTLFTITNVLAELTDELIFWILSYSFRNFTYFLFFTHTVRMVWAKPSTVIVYFGVIQYAIVQLLLILWSPLENEIGAGFISNQNIDIYSTSNRLMANLFQLYVAILFLYGYLAIKLPNPSKELFRALRIMIVVSITLLISRLVRVFQNFGLPQNDIIDLVGSISLLLGFALVAIAFAYNPGSIMLSRAQIDGVMVISEGGTPLSSLKFEGSELSGSSTLLSGVIRAVETVMGSIHEGTVLNEIDAGDRSIMVHHSNQLYFLIITNTPTLIIRGSLRYFARIFNRYYISEIEDFTLSGKIIEEIGNLVTQAFPYTVGLKSEIWN